MRKNKHPKFLLDTSPSYGQPLLSGTLKYPEYEFELLPVALSVLHHLEVIDEKVLRSLRLIKIGFGIADREPTIKLIVNGEFEEQFRAPREVRVSIPLSNNEEVRLAELGMVARLFLKDQQWVLQEIISSAELAHITLKSFVLS